MALKIFLNSLFLSLILSACGNKNITFYDCPNFPDLPKISSQELANLEFNSYKKLVERELRLRAYIRELKIFCVEE